MRDHASVHMRSARRLQLYLREGGAVTLDVSASECTVDCGTPQAFGDQFLSATPSGGHAFFTSCAKLTDDAPLAAGSLR